MKKAFKKSFLRFNPFILLLIFAILSINIISTTSEALSQNDNSLSKYVYYKQSKDEFLKQFQRESFLTYKSPFGFDLLLNHNLQDFCIAGFQNNRLVFFYTDSKNYKFDEKLSVGSLSTSTKPFMKKRIESYVIVRGNVINRINDNLLGKDYDVFDLSKDHYIFVFYDRLSSPSLVNGIFMIDKNIWDGYLVDSHVFSKIKDLSSVERDFEKISFYHLNSIRYTLGKPSFQYSSKANLSAKKHSQNMLNQNFFSHYDLVGNSPFDRMQKEGIEFSSAAENIAMGMKLLPFFANHLLLNSSGHRKNIEAKFTYVGIGVGIDAKSGNIYYTQNFYSP